jgi:hypothetical protein
MKRLNLRLDGLRVLRISLHKEVDHRMLVFVLQQSVYDDGHGRIPIFDDGPRNILENQDNPGSGLGYISSKIASKNEPTLTPCSRPSRSIRRCVAEKFSNWKIRA